MMDSSSGIDNGCPGPVTPDSVVGTNILSELDASRCSRDGDDDQVSGHDIIMGDTPSSPPSTHLSSKYDLPCKQLLNMLSTESAEKYQVSPNYLHSSVLISSAPKESKDQGVSERCRRRTCEWMYDICDYFQLNREVVGIALFYVDRYFTLTFEGDPTTGRQVPVTRRQFQLVALTGLYIAVKLHGEGRQDTNFAVSRQLGSPCQPSADDIQHSQPWNRLKFSVAICASISRNQFTLLEIEECERCMLHKLDWHVNPIVPSGTLIDSLLIHLPQDCNDESLSLYVYDCAKYAAELSVSVPALSLVYKPSVVAYASILYAIDTLIANGSKSTPMDDMPRLTAQHRQEYEKTVVRISHQHFAHEGSNVEGAKKTLQAICPNLSELFPLPSSKAPATATSTEKTPKSPNCVNKVHHGIMT